MQEPVEWWDIQLTSTTPLAHKVRSALKRRAAKFLMDNWHFFSTASMHLHVVKKGEWIGCYTNLFADGAAFHASSVGTDLIGALEDAINGLERDLQSNIRASAESVGRHTATTS